MDIGHPSFRFRGAEEFMFSFNHAELLLVAWDRDDAKFLFRVHEHSGEELVLDYPGETFSNHVLDAVQTVFFIQVDEGEGTAPTPYVMGSYFDFNGRAYGAYYERTPATGEMILFRLEGEGPETSLETISGEEYSAVSSFFMENFA